MNDQKQKGAGLGSAVLIAAAAFALFVLGTHITGPGAPAASDPRAPCPPAMSASRCDYWNVWMDRPTVADWRKLPAAERGELAAIWGARFDMRSRAHQAATGFKMAACVNAQAVRGDPARPLRPIIRDCLI